MKSLNDKIFNQPQSETMDRIEKICLASDRFKVWNEAWKLAFDLIHGEVADQIWSKIYRT